MNNIETKTEGWSVKMFTPIAQEIINLAIQESKIQKHTYVGGLHIQLALEKVKLKHSSDIFDV